MAFQCRDCNISSNDHHQCSDNRWEHDRHCGSHKDRRTEENGEQPSCHFTGGR